MSKIKVLCLVLFCFLCSVPAFAWDDVGHKLTGYIAWQQLTPAARERVIKILRSAPEDSNLSALYPQDSRSEAVKQRDLFMIATTWADIVRDREFKNRYAKYHKGNWHYSDTFWRQENGKPVIIPNPAGEEGGKAVEKLYEFEKVLRNPAASNEDKAIAVAWILHLGGDIHQPLHTSARVTDLEPKGDQGGNLFLLTPQNTPRNEQLNLHWFWDSIVPRVIARQNDACDADYLPKIADRFMKKYPRSKMENLLQLGKFDQWQQESFRIATNELFPPTLIRFQSPSEKYKKQAFEIAEQQIALAGYRLGAMLNQIFGGQFSSEITREEYEKNKAIYLKQAKETGSTIGQGASDDWLLYKTRAALAVINELRDLVINVDVNNDVVTLKGTVGNVSQKIKAETVVKNIDGVKGIKNELKVSK